MADGKNIRIDLILALAANWRSEGEYWCGTPEDARSQRCADQLLQAFGLPPDAHVQGGQDYGVLLKAHGVASHTEPTDRGNPDGEEISFMEVRAPQFIKELKDELEAKKTDRDLDSILHEKLGWAFELGYKRGSVDGVKAANTRYKRPGKKSAKK